MRVATLGSHSSLQILHGLKMEGLETAVITEKSRESLYRQFGFIDHVLSYQEPDQAVDLLNSAGDVIVPHGSLIEHIGLAKASKLKDKSIFGTRNLFQWESNQKRKMNLLRSAKIKVPKEFESPDDVDRRVIVKLPGAKGGKGYFLAEGKEEVRKGLERLRSIGLIKDEKEVLMQEYIVGVPMYFQFFRSVIRNRVEITGMDIRYESNVDGLRRLGKVDGVNPTFVVVGNIPVVARESLLPEIMNYAESFTTVVDQIVGPRMIGPFCLETVVTDEMEIVSFEFSGRIVAGTNLYVYGSPYSWLYWNEPMSVGRRIGRELKEAQERGKLQEVLT